MAWFLRESPTSYSSPSQYTESSWAGQWQKMRCGILAQAEIFLTSDLNAFRKMPGHCPPRRWPVPVSDS